MQTTLNSFTSPVRALAAETWPALLAALSLCFCAALAGAAGSPKPPIVISGTPVQLGALTGGGWDGSQEPVGGTFVVGINGNVLVGDGYSSNFLQITPGGSDTILAAGVGASNAALDSYGNLYFAGNYNANVFKVPYDAATGAYAGWASGATPTSNCKGGNQDTTPCIFAPAVSTLLGTIGGSGSNAPGFAGVAFDAQGNFFFETNTLPATNPNSIYECDTSCISNSSATPKLLYSDKSPVGAMQLDPWGNIFFVDGNNSTGKVTNLNELPLSSGSYAASPTVVLSYTNAAGYGNGISGLAISGTGTIVFSTNGDGIFAIPNTQSGGPNISGMYMLSSQGGKGVALDSKGNLYGIPYNSGDVVSFIPVNNISLGSKAIGAAATAVNATIFDSGGSCTPTLTATTTQFGVTSSEFTATAGTSCTTAFGGSNGTFGPGPLTAAGFSSISVTLNFTPAAAGERNAALVIADSTNGANGTAALTGVGQGALANLDPGIVTASITTGLTSPASAVADPAGDLFVADSAGSVVELPAGKTTLTAIGSGFTAPSALAFDANGNLFIADSAAAAVIEIPNTGTTYAFAAGTQLTLIPATLPIAGATLKDPLGLAVGPDGTLYIADSGNARVVAFNPLTGGDGVTAATSASGLANPQGLAVDAAGNLYIADPTAGKVFIVTAGVVSNLSVTGAANPAGVVVDASGSVLIADKTTGNIVRVPIHNGALDTTLAITVETIPSGASSLAADASGDLFAASSSGKAAYANQRTSALVNLGPVQDGVSNGATVYLMNAGNASVTLAAPAITQPANTMFTLLAAANQGCTDGSIGNPGDACAMTATFTPAVGTPDQTAESGSATVSFTGGTVAVNMTGTAVKSAVQAQTITNFNPPLSLVVGQQAGLSATGGGSGNPVTFSIDAASACASCATVSGNTLIALNTGTVTVDANQAAGANGGVQYAAASTVKATIAINAATVAGVPALVVNQATWIGDFSGGFTSGNNPAGGSFAINSSGEVIIGPSYGSGIQIWSPSSSGYPVTYTKTTLPALSGGGNGAAGTSVDAANNIYAGFLYGNQIWKFPFVGKAYVTTVASPVPNCAGGGADIAPCSIGVGGQAHSESGVTATAFDTNGDLFLVSSPNSAGQNGIYVIPAAGLANISNGSVTLTPVYTADVNTIASIALDAKNNLFFTDSQFGATPGGPPVNISSSQSYASNLYELANTGSATGLGTYSNSASAPVLLENFTNASAQVGSYDNVMSGLAADRTNGIVYFSTKSDGIWAFANSGTPFTASSLPEFYAVAGSNGRSAYAGDMTGGKGLAVGAPGTLYAVGGEPSSLSYADDIYMLTFGGLTMPTAQYQGTAVTAPATVVDNALAWCPATGATLDFVPSGTNASEFSGSQGTGCASIAGGSGWNGTLSTAANASSYPATITFNPQTPDTSTATLTLSDTTNGGTGTAIVTGFAQTTPQTITFTAPASSTFTYSPTLTIQLAATGGGSNNQIVFTVDKSSTGIGSINQTGLLTVTQAGSIVIDANQAGGLVNNVYYSNAPQTQLTITINKALETIAFTPPTSPQLFAPGLTVNLSATGSGSTSPIVFTVDAGSATTGAGTVSGNTLTVTQAGTIIIDANQVADANYAAAAQVQQVLVVNQATQTITVTPLTTPFHYIASCSSLVLCAQVQIVATGGATNNPVALSPDQKNGVQFAIVSSATTGATTTTTIALVPNQMLTFPANLIMDANQQGNANYSAATQVQVTIPVQAPLPLQAITWANPGTQVTGTPLTLNGSSSAGAHFPVAYISATTSVCTINNTTGTATFLTAGTCTITAVQPGDNLTFAPAIPVTNTFYVNATGSTPGLGLNLSLSSLTIQGGTVGLTQLTLTSNNNFQGSIALACSGLPAGYNCTFVPNPLVFTPDPNTGLPQATTASTNLTISGGSSASTAHRDPRPFIPLTTLAAALCFLGFRKRNRLFMLLLLVVSLVGVGVFSGCGGSSATTTKTGSSSNVTITATSGATTQSTTLTLIVE